MALLGWGGIGTLSTLAIGIVVGGYVLRPQGPAAAVATIPTTMPAATIAAAVAAVPVVPVAAAPQVTAYSPSEVFARSSNSVVRVIVRDASFRLLGQGSGFFIAADGVIVTNFHVVKDAQYVEVVRADNSTLFVDSIVASDEKIDLAILKVRAENVPFLPLASDAAPAVGTKVYAIGNPRGLTNTLSEGLISGVREDSDLPAIQTTAPISPGSSGGPLLAESGQVVGVTTAAYLESQGLNFAVPSWRVNALRAKSGEPRPLPSAGGQTLDAADTLAFANFWDAMDERAYVKASAFLAPLRERHRSNAYFWLASCRLQLGLGQLGLAEAAQRKAIDLQPDNASAWCGLGSVLMAEGKNDDALDAFARSAEIDPTSPTPFQIAGDGYFYREQYEEAIIHYRRAGELRETATGHRKIGDALLRLNRLDEALRSYHASLKLNKTHAGTYYSLGELHYRRGETKKAIAAYSTCMKYDPRGSRGLDYLLSQMQITRINRGKRYTDKW